MAKKKTEKEPRPPRSSKARKYPRSVGEMMLPVLVLLLVVVGIVDLALAGYIGYWYLSSELRDRPGISSTVSSGTSDQAADQSAGETDQTDQDAGGADQTDQSAGETGQTDLNAGETDQTT